jgi:hypothetical protein
MSGRLGGCGGVGAKFPKAAAKVTGDLDQLLAFCDYPAEHWVHLCTTNPIESTFAAVRHRTKITRGPGSRAAGLGMAFELIESAQDHWRIVNAPHLVALVRAGATVVNGKLAERPGEQAQPDGSHPLVAGEPGPGQRGHCALDPLTSRRAHAADTYGDGGDPGVLTL